MRKNGFQEMRETEKNSYTLFGRNSDKDSISSISSVPAFHNFRKEVRRQGSSNWIDSQMKSNLWNGPQESKRPFFEKRNLVNTFHSTKKKKTKSGTKRRREKYTSHFENLSKTPNRKHQRNNINGGNSDEEWEVHQVHRRTQSMNDELEEKEYKNSNRKRAYSEGQSGNKEERKLDFRSSSELFSTYKGNNGFIGEKKRSLEQPSSSTVEPSLSKIPLFDHSLHSDNHQERLFFSPNNYPTSFSSSSSSSSSFSYDFKEKRNYSEPKEKKLVPPFQQLGGDVFSSNPTHFSSSIVSPVSARRKKSKGSKYSSLSNSYSSSLSSSFSPSSSPSSNPSSAMNNNRRSSMENPKEQNKKIIKELKQEEHFDKVREMAEQIMKDTSLMSWKICLVVAAKARTENFFDEARSWYLRASHLNANEPQVWLEMSRLEEECGQLKRCEHFLLKGLDNCPFNEGLYIKLLKFYEQMNEVEKARDVLGRLKYVAMNEVQKVWKVLLEGAIMESRWGFIDVARSIFQFLMKTCPNHGSIFYEAYKLEEKCEDRETALKIIEQGLNNVPQYGPLWFACLHCYQNKNDIQKVRENVTLAVEKVTKEIIWKVYYESAQLEEQCQFLERAREQYALSIKYCTAQLRWKIWLSGARTELTNNNVEIARKLIERAEEEVPQKYRYVVLLELSKVEEWDGNITEARRLIDQAKKESVHEWKVFLESILLEMRLGDDEKAVLEAEKALKIHSGTGRLWSIYIRLQYRKGEEYQHKLFREAIKVVPKSGEVWCEGARLRLNPLSRKFNVQKAKRYLTFAIKFTPQYGDSFIEFLRGELLSKGPRVNFAADIKYLEQLCVNAEPNYGPLWFFCKKYETESSIAILRRAKMLIVSELVKFAEVYQNAILCQNLDMNSKVRRIKRQRLGLRIQSFMTGLQTFFKNKSLKESRKNVLKQSVFGDTFSI